MKICKKCGGYLGGTHNGPPTCIHGVSMKKHCCACGALVVTKLREAVVGVMLRGK